MDVGLVCATEVPEYVSQIKKELVVADSGRSFSTLTQGPVSPNVAAQEKSVFTAAHRSHVQIREGFSLIVNATYLGHMTGHMLQGP